MNDAELSGLKRALRVPDLMFQRRLTRVSKQLRQADPQVRQLILLGAAQEYVFTLRFGTDFPFYRYIQKRMAEVEWKKRNIDEITLLVLLDLLAPEHPTLHEIEKMDLENKRNGWTMESTNPKYYHPKNRARLLRKFNDIFYRPNGNEWSKDARKRAYGTMFGDRKCPDALNPYIEELLGLTLHISEASKLGHINMGMVEMIIRIDMQYRMRNVDPLHLSESDRFSSSAKISFNRIKTKFGALTPKQQEIENEVNHGGVLISDIRFTLEEAVALEWFRKHDLEKRKNILAKVPRITLNREDAATSVSACLRYMDSDRVLWLVNAAADAYSMDGHENYGYMLMRELIDQASLSSHNLATCYHNMGMFALSDTPRKALGDFVRARRIWSENKSTARKVMETICIAEAQFRLKNIERSKQSLELAKDALESERIDPELHCQALIMMAKNYGLMGEKEKARLTLEEAATVASELEDAKYALSINQAIMDFICGRTWSLGIPSRLMAEDPLFHSYTKDSLSNFAIDLKRSKS